MNHALSLQYYVGTWYNKWVPGVPSPGVKRGRGVTLTTHPHLVAEVKYE
jgi:hypothetical protein